MGHAPWSRISLYLKCVFHFPVSQHYFKPFENSENKGIDRKRMEMASFQDDSKYNHHSDTKYSCGLYDDAISKRFMVKIKMVGFQIPTIHFSK